MLLAALALVAVAPSREARAETNVLFIVDVSGSMKKKLDTGESRMDAAKKGMTDALAAMPPEARFGLLLYGHRKAKDCTDIELVSPIGADDAPKIALRIAGLKAKGARAVDAFEKMTAAREGFKKAVQEGLFRNFAGIAKKSFWETVKNVAKQPQVGKLAHSMGRDLAKMATKKALAEWLEGVPLADFLVAESESRIASWLFLAASTVYWESRDPNVSRVEERREVLRQYAPKNSMRIVKSEAFFEAADTLIVVRDKDGKPLPGVGHKVTVKLGGKIATRADQAQLSYLVTADTLTHDGKGGVALEVVVEE